MIYITGSGQLALLAAGVVILGLVCIWLIRRVGRLERFIDIATHRPVLAKPRVVVGQRRRKP